jgi:hypothetical protein
VRYFIKIAAALIVVYLLVMNWRGFTTGAGALFNGVGGLVRTLQGRT